jgi:Carboxypeptidase regulatory-like domain
MRRAMLGPLLVLTVAGCDTPRSRIHGTVTYQGKPLAGAVVTFFGADHMTYMADTGPDGTYAVEGVPRGRLRVAVQVPPPRSRLRPDPDLRKAGDSFGKDQARAEDTAKMARLPDPPPPPKAPAPADGLPLRYRDPNTSELTVELKEPDQEWSVDLK